MRLKLDWSIKVSDLLTSITIVVSVIALLISWSKDRVHHRTTFFY